MRAALVRSNEHSAFTFAMIKRSPGERDRQCVTRAIALAANLRFFARVSSSRKSARMQLSLVILARAGKRVPSTAQDGWRRLADLDARLMRTQLYTAEAAVIPANNGRLLKRDRPLLMRPIRDLQSRSTSTTCNFLNYTLRNYCF